MENKLSQEQIQILTECAQATQGVIKAFQVLSDVSRKNAQEIEKITDKEFAEFFEENFPGVLDQFNNFIDHFK